MEKRNQEMKFGIQNLVEALKILGLHKIKYVFFLFFFFYRRGHYHHVSDSENIFGRILGLHSEHQKKKV